MFKRFFKPLEFTFTSIIIGVVIGIVMTAANVYLGLYAGMTVSASIPAAVIAMGIFKGILKRNSIKESNIVQTIASAGESLAAGIIFTLPALVLVGAWQNFQFWPTTLIAICGGLLGIVFMIPLRKVLIEEDKDLTYPEGVACASVLEAGSESGSGSIMPILKGLGIGLIFKYLSGGLKLFSGSVEKAFYAGNKTWFFGTDISPALLAVGYIVRFEVAILVFIGGAIGWFIGIPAMGLQENMMEMDALDTAWTLWSSQIRYLGVGAMLVGGIWSIISVRKGLVKGILELNKSYGKNNDTLKERVDMSPISMLVILAIAFSVMLGLYHYIIGSWGPTVIATVIMIVASFIFVAVSSYIVGLVGSSNNPVSGMTISALLGTAAFFMVMGFKGDSAILATLGVAAIVCCAACTAGDCSQDLKTGLLIKSTPKYQQYAQVIGVVIPAFVIAPVLTLLHSAYGIGEGLKAPQATLFASITQAMFGEGSLPVNMVVMGCVLGVIVIIADSVLKSKHSKIRLHLMPLAVGIYLPITLSVPMLIGGIVRSFVDKKMGMKHESKDKGILLSSGLVAGEALMGVVLALFLYFNINLNWFNFDAILVESISIFALVLLGYYLYKTAIKR